MTAFTVLISIILALVIWPLVNLSRNYIQARKIGLPILFSPIGRTNPLWMATERYLAPIFKYLSTLPFPFSKVFAFAHYSTNSWFFDLKHTIHLKYGPAFLIVTPADIQLILCDAAAVEEVCLRRKDFGKDPIMYKPLNIYGPNLVSANVDSWARHRRITTPPFNERNSSLVWKESLDQATGMLRSWAKRSKEDGGVSNTPNDTMTLALHVLTAAGFGKKYDFESGVQSVGEGQEMSYRDALKIVLRNLFRAIITSSLLMGLPGWAMPKSLLRMKSAVTAVGEYMTEMMQEERAIISERDSARDNLMSVLLRSSDNEGDGKERNVLSDEEILGNLFIYNVAGHDTTANTIAYAITLLALNREVQEWIGEELAGVFGSSGEQLRSYEEAFPKLKRCMAVMYETLRLYGPVVFFPRITFNPKELSIQGKEYIIPPGTHILINLAGIHSHPSSWGNDSVDWRPNRWIDENEELVQPEPGTFLPWISGPRVCPGKKFAQVEFVSVIARLFQKYRVRPTVEDGETSEKVSKRIMEVMDDSEVDVTLHMNHPEEIKLLWEEVA